jgi:hypothetical protein
MCPHRGVDDRLVDTRYALTAAHGELVSGGAINTKYLAGPNDLKAGGQEKTTPKQYAGLESPLPCSSHGVIPACHRIPILSKFVDDAQDFHPHLAIGSVATKAALIGSFSRV